MIRRDIDYYGKPYVWKITLEDFEIDPREHNELGMAKCPFYDSATCGHPWKVCKRYDVRKRRLNHELP